MKRIIILISILFVSIAGQSQVLTPTATSLPPVIPQQSSADLQLTAQVNQKLREQISNFQQQRFNVFSQSGQVTIQGTVTSQSESDEILSAARTVPGVTVVVNGIVITR